MSTAAATGRGPSAALLALLACLLSSALAACSEDEETTGNHGDLFRDQYVFVGDEGTVLPLSLIRHGDGDAEAKGWLARANRWESVYYQHLALPAPVAPDVREAALALSRADGARARLTFVRGRSEVAFSVRRPSSLVNLGARPVRTLGRATDPEGPSVYSAGRATLRSGGERENGWLLMEETPPDQPKHAFVEYGDYVLLFAVARGDRPVVLRRSIGRDGFDNAFVGGEASGHTRRVEVRSDGDRLSVALPELALSAEGRVADRSTSTGVAPSGNAVTYQVLLVRGDLAGAAFTIRSAHTVSRRDEEDQGP